MPGDSRLCILNALIVSGMFNSLIAGFWARSKRFDPVALQISATRTDLGQHNTHHAGRTLSKYAANPRV